MKKIDYMCFSVPALGETDYNLKEGDDELLVWLKTTERALMEKAGKNDMLVVYDRSSKKFYKDGKPFNVKGKTIFPKTFIPTEKELLTALEKAGADSIMTIADRRAIVAWPKYIQPKHRKSVFTTYGEFQKNYKTYKETFKHLFLKTAQKSNQRYYLNYYGNIDIPGIGSLFITKPPIMNMDEDCKIILSEEYDQIEDKANDVSCKEYRAFVVDGEILSLSRSYIDFSTPVSGEVRAFAENFVKEVRNSEFPKSYCIDFGQMLIDGKEVIDMIECNPITSSGLEVDNDLIGSYLKIQEKDNDNFYE